MTRARTAQHAPSTHRKLDTFPSESPSGPKYRAHQKEFGPWWFASTPDGRFNLEEPDGTCYLADDVETAVRERLGELIVDSQSLSSARADQFAVSQLGLSAKSSFANTGDGQAARHGVTRELSTMTEDGYTVPRAWATAFAAAGFAGVRYPSRFTTGGGSNSWAAFGAGGEDRALPFTTVLDGAKACDLAGLRVLTVPRSARGLTII